jgi:hypothetical protein
VVGATAGYVVRGRQAPTGARAADVTYQPITFDEGFIFAARFAKDGRTIVYSADWDGQKRDVFVTSVDSPDFRPLGLPGADLLAMFPSGDLAILEDSAVLGGNPYRRKGTLSRASIMGGAPRPELENVVFADFAPDGSMAVVRREPTRFILEFPVGHVLDERPLGSSSQGFEGFTNPRVSPSGAHVALFDTSGALTARIFTRSGERVAESRPLTDWWGMAWTPGGELWFSAAEAGGRQTAVFGLDPSGQQRLVFRPPGSLTLHDVSAQGDVLASFDHVLSRMEVLDANDAAPRDVSWREGGEAVGLSNDGVVLFNQGGDSGGPKGSVFVWRPKAPRPVRIADGVGLALSPDGTTALVSSREASPKLSLVPTGAGQSRTVDAGPVELLGWAGWHPDGRIVIEIARPRGKPRVYTLSANGGVPIPLLPEGLRLIGANVIAPDGSRIVAVNAQGQLLMCTLVTCACTAVAGVRSDDHVAGWSADGSSLFVAAGNSAPVQVDLLQISTGRRTPWKTIRPRQAAVTGLLGITATTNGAILYGYSRTRTELYVIRGLR